MIRAFQKDHQLLEDIIGSMDQWEGFRLWWLGQSGFLVQWRGKHLLFDPYLSDSLTRKYEKTDKPHIRMSELVIDPQMLDFIDVVTSSHNHTDHLDAETLNPLFDANPAIEFIIPEANRAFVSERTGRSQSWPIGLNDRESYKTSAGFEIHGIPAAHNELKRDEHGNCHFMGYVVKFGDYCIFHSGDTLWHKEVVEALQHFRIDVGLLPINGNLPERRVAGNLNAEEAVALGRKCRMGTVIPCHYHMFTFNTVEPDEFISLAKEGNQPFRVLQVGEGMEMN